MVKRTALRVGSRLEGRKLARATSVGLGRAIQAARKRRGWSQRVLGERVGLSSWRIGAFERGDGSRVGLEIWFALGQALGLPFKAEFGWDATEEPLDAGHLGMQE